MTFEEIKTTLLQLLGESFQKGEVLDTAQPQLIISKENLVQVCDQLLRNPSFYFDSLSCLTALDNGPAKGTMEVIYHLYSIPFNHHLVLKVEIDRSNPSIDSVSSLWRTADWHEREAFDFFGIQFNNHPDLRRILLPGDWEGFPLRKDYQQQETYHGIKVAY
jgi:NADH-quinone oxidoreductase subunit C